MGGGEGRGVYLTLLQWEEESQNRPTTSRLLKLIQFNSSDCLFWPCLVAVSATQALHLPPTLKTPQPSAPQADLLNLRSAIDSQSVLSPPPRPVNTDGLLMEWVNPCTAPSWDEYCRCNISVCVEIMKQGEMRGVTHMSEHSQAKKKKSMKCNTNGDSVCTSPGAVHFCANTRVFPVGRDPPHPFPGRRERREGVGARLTTWIEGTAPTGRGREMKRRNREDEMKCRDPRMDRSFASEGKAAVNQHFPGSLPSSSRSSILRRLYRQPWAPWN